MIGILAVLSVSAAAGMRIALPLLVIGLIQGDLWQQVPSIRSDSTAGHYCCTHCLDAAGIICFQTTVGTAIITSCRTGI